MGRSPPSSGVGRLTAVDPTTDHPEGARSPGAVDLDAVAADLAAVEQAMARIEDGTYWTEGTSAAPPDGGSTDPRDPDQPPASTPGS